LSRLNCSRVRFSREEGEEEEKEEEEEEHSLVLELEGSALPQSLVLSITHLHHLLPSDPSQ
jgi:hypothetical protein